MKYILILLVSFAFGQNQDSLKCVERGHVKGGIISTTLMYCSPYIEETDLATYLVYPACNYESYTCLRCGKYISELEKENKILIWKKEEVMITDTVIMVGTISTIADFGIMESDEERELNDLEMLEYYERYQRPFDEKGLIQVTMHIDGKKVDTYFPTILSYGIYAKECYADTIRLEKFGNEYLFRHEHYGEMFTERRLNKQGYFYQYRWITNTIIDENNLMEFEYIFVKEPTFKGFIEWYERSKQ